MAEYERIRRLREKADGLSARYKIKSDDNTGLANQGQTGAVRNADKRHEHAEKGTVNKKSVWTIATKPYSEAHFAVYPKELIVDCIKAGCPRGGVVLDPFMGTGTTAIVSKKLDRNFIGFELNPKSIKISDKRIHDELGLFK